ncbi:MAG: invasion associated locus B family protein [Gammaproteobacteria bacterium]
MRFLITLSLAALLGFTPTLYAIKDGDSFGNWLVRCGPQDSGDDQGCFLFQNLVLKEGGQRVLQVAVGFVDNAPEPIALLSLPLGISLPPGAKMSIDDEREYKLQIERCEINGCRAGLKLTAALIEKFRRGNALSVLFYDSQRRPIEVPLSLDGFVDGFQALETSRKQ